MTINELLALNGLTANDEIPVWDAEAEPNEPTKKITGSNLAASIKTLGSLLGTSDVVNSLTSTATDKPLAAAQGKALNDNNFLGPTGRCFTIDPNSYNNNVDSIVDAIHVYYPGGGYFSVDIVGNLTNPQTNANRNFIYGFVNGGNSFGWVIIESFAKRFRGIRQGASTFTFTQI